MLLHLKEGFHLDPISGTTVEAIQDHNNYAIKVNGITIYQQYCYSGEEINGMTSILKETIDKINSELSRVQESSLEQILNK